MLSRAVGRIHPTTEYLRNGPPIHLHSTVLETRWFKNVTASVDYGSDLPRLKAMTSFTQHRGSTLWLRFDVRLPSLIRRPTVKKIDDQPVIIMPRLRMFPIRSTHLPNNHFSLCSGFTAPFPPLVGIRLICLSAYRSPTFSLMLCCHQRSEAQVVHAIGIYSLRAPYPINSIPIKFLMA